MPRWKIHRNFVAPVLEAAGLEFSDVAYVNLLKWRTTTDAGRAFQRHCTRPVDFDFIPRAIGNNVGQAGRVALARIASKGKLH